MKRNVFLKSTLRQPVRVLLLLLVIGLASSAFISRAAEYLLVKQETERLSGYYRSIATLETLENGADGAAATKYLEQNPYVKLVDKYQITSGVLQDGLYNADTDGYMYNASSTEEFGYSSAACKSDSFFYGTLLAAGTADSHSVDYSYSFRFRIDSVVAGYPEYISKGGTVTLVGGPELEEAFGEMTVGARYLVRAAYNPLDSRCVDLALHPQAAHVFLFKRLTDENPWFLEAEEALDLSNAQYSRLLKEIRLVDDNQRALYVIATADMSAMPSVQEASRAYYLTDGRWLNAEDQASGNMACVIHAGFAAARGLKLGDTVSMELRNVYSVFGYLATEEDVGNVGNFPTHTAAYEIVGIFDIRSENISEPTFYQNYVFIPQSTFPSDFSPKYSEDGTARSIELVSPADQDAFLLESKDALAELGFRAVFLENGWNNFKTAEDSMQRSSLYGALVFAVVLTVALCLTAFIYFRFRRKEFAICRALGVPASRCGGQAAVPLLLVGLAGIAAGGALAWRYINSHATELLHGLYELVGGSSAVMPVNQLVLLCLGVFTVLLAVTLVFSACFARKNVLRLFQGNPDAKKDAAQQAGQDGASEVRISAVKLLDGAAASIPPARIEHGKPGAMQALRFTWRQMIRSHLKTALAILLAGVFIVGLSAVRLSILSSRRELDELYQTITVDLEITKLKPDTYLAGEGFIREEPIEGILNSGYIDDYYLEGAYLAQSVIKATEDGSNWDTENARENVQLRSFTDAQKFFSGRGSGFQVTYFDGWDGSLFAEEWNEKSNGIAPVIVSRTMYDTMKLSADSTLIIMVPSGSQAYFVPHRVAGIYDNASNDILTPTSALKRLVRDDMRYCAARFTIDPAMNSQIDTVYSLIYPLVSSPTAGLTALSTVVWDQELTQAVRPLEQTIRFMQVLYPVLVALSLAISAGISILFTVMSAKNVSIMRVLGTSRLRCGLILCLQMLSQCVLGLSVGFLAVVLLVSSNSPQAVAEVTGPIILYVALYFFAAVLGSVISAAVMVGKNPLELLQVKE